MFTPLPQARTKLRNSIRCLEQDMQQWQELDHATVSNPVLQAMRPLDVQTQTMFYKHKARVTALINQYQLFLTLFDVTSDN